MDNRGYLTDVPGITVGHAHDEQGMTGCTVILAEQGAVGGVDVRGSAPGTREIEALKPVRLVNRIHAVLLTGGSAFGLRATEGIQRYLEERGIGFVTSAGKVPVVPTAVIYDLAVGECGALGLIFDGAKQGMSLPDALSDTRFSWTPHDKGCF